VTGYVRIKREGEAVIEVRQDSDVVTDVGFIASDAAALVYGWGKTQDEAVADYQTALAEFLEITR